MSLKTAFTAWWDEGCPIAGQEELLRMYVDGHTWCRQQKTREQGKAWLSNARLAASVEENQPRVVAGVNAVRHPVARPAGAASWSVDRNPARRGRPHESATGH